MLTVLREELDKNDNALKIVYRIKGGSGTEGVLLAVDTTGACIQNSEGLCFYPWDALLRIRIIDEQ